MTTLSLKNSYNYYDQLHPDNQYPYFQETNPFRQAIAQGWHDTALKLIQKSETLEELVPKKDLATTVHSIFSTKSQSLINATISKCQSLIFLEDSWGRTPLFWARYHRLPQVATELHHRGLHHYCSFNFHPKNLELSVCLFSPRDHKLVDAYQQFLHIGSHHQFIMPIFRELWWKYYSSIFMDCQNTQQLTVFPSKHYCDTISQSLLLAATNAHPHVLMNQYIKSEMVILPTGWYHHAICIVFIKDLVLICNKGEESSLQTAPLQIYRFNPKKLHSGILSKILKSKYVSKEVSEIFLYKTFLKNLNVYQDAFCISVQKQVCLKTQKYSNCTVTCNKVALLGLCLCYHEAEKTIASKTYDILWKFYKGFTNYSRTIISNKYINTIYENYITKMLE